MNEIVQFKSDTGLDVTITPSDVKNFICPAANDKEIAMFLELCRAQHLNPYIKDAYLIKYGSAPASIITGKEVFTKRANANPLYEGIEHGIVFMRKTSEGITVSKREGAAVYKAAGETLLGGWARVHVKNKLPVYCELALDEYSTGKSNWLKMPAVMIDKCAQVGALRLAFPDSFQGLYAQEEMGQAGEIVASGAVVEAEVVEMASDAQLEHVNELVMQFADLRAKTAQEAYSALESSATLQAAGVTKGGELTGNQAELAIQLLDNWINKAQAARQDEICEEYAATVDDENQQTAVEVAEIKAAAALFGGEYNPEMSKTDIPF